MEFTGTVLFSFYSDCFKSLALQVNNCSSLELVPHCAQSTCKVVAIRKGIQLLKLSQSWLWYWSIKSFMHFSHTISQSSWIHCLAIQNTSYLWSLHCITVTNLFLSATYTFFLVSLQATIVCVCARTYILLLFSLSLGHVIMFLLYRKTTSFSLPNLSSSDNKITSFTPTPTTISKFLVLQVGGLARAGAT